MNEDLPNYNENPIHKILSAKKATKILYGHQLKNESRPEVKAEKKWEQSLENSNIEWNKVYTISFYCTIDQKLRNFQYKYLMQIVRTNDFLLKCKLVQSNICDFCNMHVETVQHLFWECMYAQNFWQKLVDFLKSKDIAFECNYKSISLGVSSGSPK